MAFLFADAENDLVAGAVFNETRTHRYRLWRRWEYGKPQLNFIMLNPSTADETALDQTVRACIRRAKRMGFGAVQVTNLFALRSTDPRALYTHADPVGEGNDGYIERAARTVAHSGGMVIAAWGAHGKLKKRGEQVRLMLQRDEILLYALVVNKDGSPKHPLYVADAAEPTRWE